jgi:hypothetical protein
MQNTDIQRTTAIGLSRYAYEYIDAAMIVKEVDKPEFEILMC